MWLKMSRAASIDNVGTSRLSQGGGMVEIRDVTQTNVSELTELLYRGMDLSCVGSFWVKNGFDVLED